MPVWGVWEEDGWHFGFSCGPRSRKARNLATNPRAVVMSTTRWNALSVEGWVAPVVDASRQTKWIDRYLAKYQPFSQDISAEFLHHNLMVEFVPERAFAVIEREADFSARATRWVFGE